MNRIWRWFRAWRMARVQDAMVRAPLAQRVATARSYAVSHGYARLVHWPRRLTQWLMPWGPDTRAVEGRRAAP